MKINILLPALALCIALASCSNDPKDDEHKQPEQPEKTEPRIYAPKFSADSAYRLIEQQVNLGPRTPGSKAHAQCAEWMVEKLKGYGLEVTVQKAPITTFDSKKYTLHNIIASYKPELGNRVLLCAHWDSRPWAEKDTKDTDKPIDAADDGASGVAVLMEIARLVSTNKLEKGIDIVLFDLEDYGQNGAAGEGTWGLGSQYWSKNLHKPGYTAEYGILLDMVGAKDATFAKEGNSRQYAPDMVEKIWRTAERAGYSYYFVNAEVNAITDDHYYVNTVANIPTVDIINMSPVTENFGAHHHTHDDNIGIIDKKTLEAVGQTVMEVLYSK
jgi:Zn-dependent M28 family amino/carboxypeptidase